jgi:hypothetical protein
MITSDEKKPPAAIKGRELFRYVENKPKAGDVEPMETISTDVKPAPSFLFDSSFPSAPTFPPVHSSLQQAVATRQHVLPMVKMYKDEECEHVDDLSYSDDAVEQEENDMKKPPASRDNTVVMVPDYVAARGKHQRLDTTKDYMIDDDL